MTEHATVPAVGTPESEHASYRRLVFAIAYRMVGSVVEAEDIVQEAFLRLHRARQEGTIVESPKAGLRIARVEVNGQPGARVLDPEGRIVSVVALDIEDGGVRCVRSVVNPEKLRHLGPVSDLLTRPLRRPEEE